MVNAFIEEIAKYVIKYAPQYDIRVHSPIIAQAILESAKGTSNKVKIVRQDGSIEWRHNYFGLKWRNNRCAVSNDYFEEHTAEQNKDGSYTNIISKFCKFKSMEEGVIGYFQWTNTANYSDLKGVTNPKIYLENIKADGYATSLKYVDNLMQVIKTYNLTQYDNEEATIMAKKIIALDAGHGKSTAGKRCMKALDPNETREWFLNDRISDRVEELLGSYECQVVRVGDTTGAKDISLSQRVKTANNIDATVYISVHHNAGVKGKKIGYKGKPAGGTVVYYYSNKDERKKQAQALYNDIIRLTGLVGDRTSTVIKNGFYVIKNTKMPAFLIENGFMDSPTDVPIILSEAHAEKTAQAIVTFLVREFKLEPKPIVTPSKPVENGRVYRVQCGAYGTKENAEALRKKIRAAGFDAIIV